MLQSLGLDHSQLGHSHSFRIGAASSCSKAGIEDHLIKTLERWSSDCHIHTPLSAVSEVQRKNVPLMIPGIPCWIIYACSLDVFVNSVEVIYTYQPLNNIILYTGFGYKISHCRTIKCLRLLLITLVVAGIR